MPKKKAKAKKKPVVRRAKSQHMITMPLQQFLEIVARLGGAPAAAAPPPQPESLRDRLVSLHQALQPIARDDSAPVQDVATLCYHALAAAVIRFDAAGGDGDPHVLLNHYYVALGATLDVAHGMRDKVLEHASGCERCKKLSRAANLAPPDQKTAN